jgi:exoribonuclease-2
MIVTNTSIAQFLVQHGGSSLRRIVRSPERWLRICEYVRQFGSTLPKHPDSKALEKFLSKQHQKDPLHFPDISLTIIKLMGSGEYVVEQSGQLPIGHFGLAVQDYTHSTAPNRRYPDLITLRMVKAILSHEKSPYSIKELEELALHCTDQEDATRKVERRIRKSEAALYLQPLLGSQFTALVTGINNNGTWVRLLSPPVEGMLIHNATALSIGEKIRVKLVTTDVERGFIDFIRVH